MSIKVKTLLEDPRPIARILFQDGDEYIEGTKILPYGEQGPAGMIAMLAVFMGKTITHRIPAYMVQIEYE